MAEKIRDAIGQARMFLLANPEKARSTDSAATATIEAGLRCRVSGPNGAVLISDMTPGVGGDGSAPSPGWLMRAAHASCDATLIAMKAAEEGVELSRLEVVVDSESDDRGLLGMSDEALAGPISTRVRIKVAASGVAEERLREIVEWAREHSPVDDAMARAVPLTVEIQVGDPVGR